MLTHPDVLILGGGVIGLTTAYFLAREGATVEVVDKGDLGQEASWAGAGIIPPGNPATARTPFDRLRAHSAALYPRLSAELRERTGIDNGYLRCGGLEFIAEGETIDQEWHGEGVSSEIIGGPDLARLEPALEPSLTRACHLPDLAQVRNPRHLKALVAACTALGVRLRTNCPVHGFEEAGGKIVSARSAAGPLFAKQYLLCTGAWTDGLLDPLGIHLDIRPVRGQIALLNPGVPLVRRVLMHGPRYLVPRPDGRILVGSTEEDVGFDKRTTAAGIQGLLSLAIALVPRLAEAPVERCWAGLRPGSPDGLPFIGPAPGIENLLVAAGHFRAGIQLAPATALVLTELLQGVAPTVALDPFALDRAAAPRKRGG